MMAKKLVLQLKSMNRYYRFFLSYVGLSVTLLLVMGGMMYWNFVHKLQSEVEASNFVSLSRVRDVIDQRLYEMNSLAWSIADNPVLTPYQVGIDGFSLLQTFRELKKYKESNSFISDIALYYRSKTPDLMHAASGTWSLEQFFRQAYNFGTWDLNQFLLDLDELRVPHMRPFEETFKHGSMSGKHAVYLYPLPFNANKPYGVVMFIIKEDAIKSMIYDILRDYKGVIYVLNEAGVPLLQLSGNIQDNASYETWVGILDLVKVNEGVIEARLAGEDFSVVKLGPSRYGWSYAAIMPTRQFRQEMVDSTKILIGTIAALMLMALLFSLLFAKRINRKVDQATTDLHSRIKSQASLLKERYIYSLLRGKYEVAEFQELHRNVDISFRYPYFVVVLFLIDDYDNFIRCNDQQMQELVHLALRNALEELAMDLGQGYPVDLIDAYGTVMLVNMRQADLTPVEHLARRALDFFRVNFKLTLTAGIGNIYEEQSLMPRSFLEARSAARYRFMKGYDQVIAYRDTENLPFQLSVESQQQLLLMVRGGELEKIPDAIHTILRQRTSELGSLEELEVWCFDLVTSMVRLLKDMNLSDSQDFKQHVKCLFVNQFETVEQWMQAMTRFATEVAAVIGSAKKESHLALIDQLLEYVEERFTDESISLEKIADKFHLSPSHITQLFKAHTGITLMKYVDKLRMDKVKTMLQETDLTVKELIVQCGYLDYNHFIRKFKALEGITPAAYRRVSAPRSASRKEEEE